MNYTQQYNRTIDLRDAIAVHEAHRALCDALARASNSKCPLVKEWAKGLIARVYGDDDGAAFLPTPNILGYRLGEEPK